jgi:hypothetical protein
MKQLKQCANIVNNQHLQYGNKLQDNEFQLEGDSPHNDGTLPATTGTVPSSPAGIAFAYDTTKEMYRRCE